MPRLAGAALNPCATCGGACRDVSTAPLARADRPDAEAPHARRGLPEPRAFDPVRFPGTAAPEDWPPAQFDFASPWMREKGLQFERDPSGAIRLAREFGHLRILLDLDRAHALFDIAPGTRDFLLLRLIPAALRLRETVAPGDPVPEVLRTDEPELPQPHHLYAATAALVDGLSRAAGEEGLALSEALRRVPPGADMIEQAVARCVARDGFTLSALAPLARRLQRLANAHARVLAAVGEQPDYVALEAAVQRTRQAIAGDRRWAGDLLALALGSLAPQIARPRQTVEHLTARARGMLLSHGLLRDIGTLTRQQEDIRDRLTDLGIFWRRTAMAWAAVEPAATDRRDIEALTRNAQRRLSLVQLYRLEIG
jgi:hypothetical protein